MLSKTPILESQPATHIQKFPYHPGFIYAAYASEDGSQEITVTPYYSMPMFLESYIHGLDVSNRETKIPDEDIKAEKIKDTKGIEEADFSSQKDNLKADQERDEDENDVRETRVSAKISEDNKAKMIADPERKREEEENDVTKGRQTRVPAKIDGESMSEEEGNGVEVSQKSEKNVHADQQREEAAVSRGNKLRIKVPNDNRSNINYHNKKESDQPFSKESLDQFEVKTKKKPVGFPLKGEPGSKTLTAIEFSTSKKLKISSQKFPCYIPKIKNKVILS